jgi:hypothetical protein
LLGKNRFSSPTRVQAESPGLAAASLHSRLHEFTKNIRQYTSMLVVVDLNAGIYPAQQVDFPA